MLRFAYYFLLGYMPIWTCAQVLNFEQISDPPGFVNQSQGIEAGTEVTTITAPSTLSGSYFTHWTINGLRATHAVNKVLNPVGFTLLEPTTAVAHYLIGTVDDDADGVPDWFELRYHGSTNLTAMSDVDFDLYALDAEYRLGFTPRLANRSYAGGVNLRRSAPLAFSRTSSTRIFSQTSTPPGVLDQLAFVSNGTTNTTVLPPDSFSGLRFAYWEIPGVNSQAFFGSRRQLPVVTTADVYAVAHYFNESQDADGDGVADFYEFRTYGDLSHDGTADSDLDGIPLSEELERGFNGVLHDYLHSGGVMRRRSTPVFVSLGLPQYSITSSPPGVIDLQGTTASNTVIQTPLAPLQSDVLTFGYWSINGQRIARAKGEALQQVQHTVTGDTDFVAHYFNSDEDTDADHVPDWYEWFYTGHLNALPNEDLDGDGRDLETEAALGFNVNLFDRHHSGGVAHFSRCPNRYRPAVF